MDWIKSFFGILLFLAALYYLRTLCRRWGISRRRRPGSRSRWRR
jgi:hypothetical protein